MGLAVDGRGLNNDFFAAVQREGIELGVWTIDIPAIAKVLRQQPVTWIETNDPKAIGAALAD